MDVKKICTVLPYPIGISVNHCWKRAGNKTFLAPAVRRYRQEVWATMGSWVSFNDEPVRVEIGMFPPDKRRRDADTAVRAVALGHAGTLADDSQIMQLYVQKYPPVKGGKLDLTIISL